MPIIKKYLVKVSGFFTLSFLIIFLLFIVSPGYCQTADQALEQLRLELKSEGVPDEFIKIIGGPAKRMLASSALADDVKNILLILWDEGLSGMALMNAVSAVAELVESGDNVLDAAEITSGAAYQAESEGLSGFGIGMRVRKSVQERKAVLRGLKNNAQ